MHGLLPACLTREAHALPHPPAQSCSSQFKEGPFDGSCSDGGKSAGSDTGGAQFEHSSLSATVKSLFNLSAYLTAR